MAQDKKKVLFTATVQSHIMNFHLPYLQYWYEKGYEVHVATQMDEIKYKELMEEYPYLVWHDVKFSRNPFSIKTFISYKQLKNIMINYSFEFMHTNTPIASVISRLAAKKCGIPKVLYTAHGFHFFKGAPIQNWMIYYPLEKLMARYTDVVITINDEDYQLAKSKFKIRKSNGIYKLNGVGLDLNKYTVPSKINYEFKKSLDIPENNYVITIIGELNKNKNQIQMINAVEKLNDEKTTLLLVGDGENYERYKNCYKNNQNIKILGYRTDIKSLLNISDVVASMSYREGLPKNVMEAMTAGKAVIATKIRGNKDLVSEGETGYLVDIGDVNKTMDIINKIRLEKYILGQNAKKSVQDFSIDIVIGKYNEIIEDFDKRL